MKKELIVIEGPTASGKTALAIELAKKWKTVVVSADSRQFYKELSIGTAKPDQAEQDGVKHYFIDSHYLKEELTSAQYAEEAMKVLNEEFKVHDKIIMVGGSGMFIDAVCIGLDPIPKSNEIKKTIEEEYKKNGVEGLLLELKEKDPTYYQQVDRQNPMRILRAIEVIRLTNKPYSEQRTNQQKSHFFEIKRFVIQHDREKLYERINLRVDQMIKAGLLEEAKSVFYLRDLKALNTVGYKELFDYFDGKTTYDEAINLIKQNTRRYAKRQLTWFRRHPEAIWIDYTSTKEMALKIEFSV